MKRGVFDPENLLWSLLGRAVDVVGLSLLWALLCLPVVTIGPATAALYYTCVKCLRLKEKGTFGVYWKSFKGSLRIGIPATLICLPVAFLLAFGYAVMKMHWSTKAGAIMFVAYDIALIVPAGILCWLFPLIGRFDHTLKSAFRTAGLLALRHLPSTIIVVLLTAELLIYGLERWWPVLFAPSLCALLTSLFFERIFPKYLDEDEMRRLNDTSETPLEDD